MQLLIHGVMLASGWFDVETVWIINAFIAVVLLVIGRFCQTQQRTVPTPEAAMVE